MRKELTIMTLSGLVALSSMPGASPVYAVNNNSIDDLAESIRSKSAKTIYVEEKNGNTYVADGSSNKPYKDIKTAIEKAEDGDTLIIVGSASYTKYDKDDVGAALPLFINKKITIQGNNSSSSLSSRAPIQLGADVTFKDISLEMVPEVILGRQASGSESRILGNKNPRAATIFAAGHKLTLNNVTTKVGNNTDDDRPYISGGTYKKHDSNIGSKSIINIINGRDETKFAAIYAGDYWTDRNMNVEINIDGKVQVLDQKIHAGGFDFDLNGTVDINIKGSNNIKNIEKNNYSGNINVTLKSSNDIYDIYELNFNGIHDLTLENKVRLVIPENGQFEVDNVTLGQKSRIDFRNMVKQENVTNNPTINGNLYGVTTSSNAEQYGCILVGNTQTLEIEGNVTGITKLNVGTSADSIDKFVMEHQYIKASENSEGTFSIEGTTEQKCEVKRSVENNKTVWTIVESEESEDPFGRFEWNGGDNKIVIPTLLESNAPLEYEYAIKFMDTNGQEYDVNKEFGYLNDNFTYILENSDGVFDLEQYDGADLIWDEFNPKIILCIYPEEKIDDLYGSYKLSVIHNRTSAKISKNISIVRESDQLTELTGTVSITGQAIEGNTISADISQLPSNCEGIKYEWYIDDKVVSGAEEKSFKLTSKHIGKSVKVKVTADNYSGSILSDSVIVEEKQPEVADKVDKSELKALYDKCINTGYEGSDYTEESFKAYEDAIKEAESVLSKEDSTQEEVNTILEKLKEAIEGLKKQPEVADKVDKSELKALYDKCISTGYKESDYTEESFKAYEDAIKEAESVLSKEDSTQEEVNTILEKLKEAVEGLKKQPEVADKVDKSELKALYDKCINTGYEGSDYTEDSFKAYEDVIKEAESVLSKEDSTQEEVNTILEKLKEAIEGLKKQPEVADKVDKSELKALYDKCISTGYEGSDYTEDSFKAYEDAIKEAESVLSKEDSTQEEVNTILEKLKEAVEGLKKQPEVADKVDKSELKALYDKCISTGYKESDYTEESFKAYEDAIKEAESVLSKEDSTQEEVNTILEKLKEAIEGLKKQPEVADKVELKALYDKCISAGYKESDYTEESFKAYEDAIKEAKIILNKEDSTQEEVDAVLGKLKEAIEGLKKQPEVADKVDKSELKALYDKCISAGYKESDYTEDSFKAYENAIKEAKIILNKEDSTQEEVNTILEKLKEAIEWLKKQPEVADKVDKSELKDLYDKCISTGYKESDYTEESFKAYENAIKEAESVLNKEDSTQEEVDAVLGKLRNSINALKKKPQSNSGSNNTGSSSSGGSSNSGSSSGGSSGGSSSSGSSSGSSTSTENTTNDKKEDTKVDQNSNTKPEEKKTDWDSKDGNWYVKLEDGSNAKGWYKDEGSGKWYMFDKETGAMKTGWQKDDNGKWYHLSSSGEMNTGWYKDSNNKWYKLDNSGAMVTGWHKDNNGKWYHLNNSGEMNTGWYKDSNNKWYNLDSSGAMVTGWLKDNNGKWYYLNSDGSMAANTTIDGYKLGSDGAWIR